MPSHRPRRRDFERFFARLLCGVFALIGLLPLLVAGALRSAWVRARVEQEARAAIAQNLGVSASFRVELTALPPEVRAFDLLVPSTDGGEPAIAIDAVRVAPRIFSLLAGKLDAGTVEIERPRIRAVIENGALTNLAYKLPPPSKAESTPLTQAPFRVLAITDASFDVTVVAAGLHAVVHDLDVDVAAGEGLSFSTGVRMAGAEIDRKYTNAKGNVVLDEDAICDLDARVEASPELVLVRRLGLRTRLDDDGAAGTRPSCEGEIDAENRLDLDLAHVRISPNVKPIPAIDGHVRVAAPLRVIGRAVPAAPGLNGNVVVDADIEWDGKTPLPTVRGELHGRELMLMHERSLSHVIDSTIEVSGLDVSLPHAVSNYGDATVTITNAKVGVLRPGVPVDVDLVDIKDLHFPGLMRDLGITPRTHVAWVFDTGQIRHFKGFIDDPQKHGPMLLGDIQAQTRDFEVFDKPTFDPARRHLIGIHRAAARGKFGIEPNGAVFKNMSADFGKSHADVPSILVGFVDAVEVIVGDKTHVDLADISPIADVMLGGVVDVTGRVFGVQSGPHIAAKASVTSFKLGDMPLADTAEFECKFEPYVVETTHLHATKGTSAYDLTKLKLDINGSGVVVDAEGGGKALDFRDVLAMLRFDADPRFLEIHGSADAKASFHYERGTPADRCGAGLFDVRAETVMGPMDVYGERYDGGAGEIRFTWFDPNAAERGVEASVPSFVVRKGRGTIVGAGAIHAGAALRGHFVASDIPLDHVDSFGPLVRGIDGAINATGELFGYADAFGADAHVAMTPLRVGQKKLAGSGFELHLEPSARKAPIPGKMTRCGAPITAPFDPKSLAKDEPKGVFHLTGQMFGGQIRMNDVQITQQRDKVMRGGFVFDGADIGAAGQLVPALVLADVPPSGRLSGSLEIATMPFEHLDHSAAKMTLTELALKQGSRSIALQKKAGNGAAATITVANGDVVLSPMTVDVADAGGANATVDLTGKVRDLAGQQLVDADLSIHPIDLAAVAALMPNVDSASGRIEASFHVGGTVSKPIPRGELRVASGALTVHGLPASLEDVNLVARIDERELRIDQATARASGGRVTLSLRAPLDGLTLGTVTAKVDAADVHLDLADGVETAVDANIRATWTPPTLADPTRHKAMVEGDVAVKSFLYSRPINVTANLDNLAKTARRTAVSVYDPDDDTVEFDIAIRPERPLVFRNNLVDAQVSLDSDALVLHGTNQRMGLEGALRVDKGSHLRLRDNEFEIRQGTIRFDDRTAIKPRVDVTATTDYRRYTTSTSAPTTGGTSAASAGGSWRFTLHAHGDADDMRIDLSSEPNLAQEDIVLMLTIGLTRAELDQLQAANVGGAAALEALSAISGASTAVRTAVPIIDDFRLGSAYSPRTGRTEPTVTVGKRLSSDVRANVITGLTDNRDVRSNVEWRLGDKTSILGNYDNLNDVTSQGLGNLGADFRVRLEF